MKKNLKTTICVDGLSQLIVSYNVFFGYIHDSKEFKKTLDKTDREIIGKFKNLQNMNMLQFIEKREKMGKR